MDPEAAVDVCGPVEKQAQPAPLALVREFVRRDGKVKWRHAAP
ncbi:MAG TPA: hypothetical protein VE153_25505 [Myxococcus sp.]|nr:hypothetical protein [Myxococcus sp.]